MKAIVDRRLLTACLVAFTYGCVITWMIGVDPILGGLLHIAAVVWFWFVFRWERVFHWIVKPMLEAQKPPLPGLRVVCAAIRNGDRVICGVRHFDEFMVDQIKADGGDWRRAEQGFVTNQYRFVTREQGREIARASGQILREYDHDYGQLFSENLY
ncbi:MAG: hypothetical protein ACE15D_18900 [Candidatus Eisenbacteria bacterium]